MQSIEIANGYSSWQQGRPVGLCCNTMMRRSYVTTASGAENIHARTRYINDYETTGNNHNDSKISENLYTLFKWNQNVRRVQENVSFKNIREALAHHNAVRAILFGWIRALCTENNQISVITSNPDRNPNPRRDFRFCIYGPYYALYTRQETHQEMR